MTADLSSTGGRDVHTVRFPVATPPSEIEVLVVGAGPSGLGAAVELTAHGVQVAVVDRAREATLVRAGAMGHSPRTVEHFRRWGLLQAIRDEWTFPRRAEIAALLSGGFAGRGGLIFDERYDASPVVWYEPGQLADETAWEPGRYEDDPRPGHRAPNGEVDPYGSTLYDRIGNSLALLVIGDTTCIDRSVEHALVAEAASRGLPFTVVHLSEPSLRAVYGDGTVLVRPDQHVAWRGTSLPQGGAAVVLDHVLGIRQAAEAEVPEAGSVLTRTAAG